ncbi:MAG: hypothetical protein WDN04_19245 [Rhodospirillales bacterium]
MHLLQIWLLPGVAGLAPGYEQKSFGGELDGALRLVASRDARDGSVTIHQDADLYAGRLAAGPDAGGFPPSLGVCSGCRWRAEQRP